MHLQWVRLDANVAMHDKMLALLADPSSKKWQASASYFFGLAWSGGTGTDGVIPKHALPFVHGTEATARLLVKYRLWQEALTGWQIVNFGERQELSAVTAGKREARRTASEKANCRRWHGDACWKEGRGCSRDLP